MAAETTGATVALVTTGITTRSRMRCEWTVVVITSIVTTEEIAHHGNKRVVKTTTPEQTHTEAKRDHGRRIIETEMDGTERGGEMISVMTIINSVVNNEEYIPKHYKRIASRRNRFHRYISLHSQTLNTMPSHPTSYYSQH